MLKLVAALAAVSVLAFAPAARADEPDTGVKTEQRWYGYQTLAADGAALGLGALALASDGKAARTGFGTLATASYTFAPLVIHALHDRAGVGVGDFFIRAGAPIVFALTGALISFYAQGRTTQTVDGAEPVDVTTGAAVGFGAGIVLASALDAAVFAREKVAAPAVAPAAKTGMTVLPTAAPVKDGFSAGFVGTF